MRRMLHLASVLLASLVALCGITVYADTHWVNLNGSNQPPYTSYTAGAHSIQDAVNQSVAGDTVRIATGIYRPDTTIFLKDSIVVMGAGRDSTIIRSEYDIPEYKIGAILHLQGSPTGGGGLTFQGCTVWGHRSTGKSYPDRNGLEIYQKPTAPNSIFDNTFYYCIFALDIFGANVAVWNNHFDSNFVAVGIGARGSYHIHHNTMETWSGGGEGVSASLSLVDRTSIHHNVIFSHLGPGINVVAIGDSVLINNNLIVTTRGHAVAASCDQCAGLIVRNNTFVRTVFEPVYPFAGFYASPSTEIIVESNVFSSLNGEVWLWGDDYGGGPIRFRYNALWGLDSGTAGYGLFKDPANLVIDTLGNIHAEPMFADEDSFYLQRGSPLIDQGNPSILLLDVDGSRSDIGWTGGPEGVRYEFPELPPDAPDSLQAHADGDSANLIWRANTESDLAVYRLYRNTYSGFIPSSTNLRATITRSDTTLADRLASPGIPVYYLLTAVDTAGLESNPSNEVTAQATGILDEGETSTSLPTAPSICGIFPNPFNSATAIEVSIPAVGASPAPVQLLIYNSLGQQVAVAFDGRLEPGVHQIKWNAQTPDGRSLPSGVYFARFLVWGYEFKSTVKLVLEK